MTERMRRLLLRDSCMAAVINMAIGGTITWLVFGRLSHVPVWGLTGLVADSIPSTFMPVLGLCFGISSAIRQRRRAGRLTGIGPDIDAPAWIRRIPSSVPLRALGLAVLTTAIVLPLTALGFRAVGVASLMLPTVFVLKLSQLAVIGFLVGPIVVYRALLDR